MTSLDGARVLITGASGGLGAPVSRMLAEQGARLVLVARDAGRLEALRIPGAVGFAVDLTRPDGARASVEAAVAHLGGLDGVVHLAGVVAFGPAVETDDATLETLVATNLLAPMRLVRAAYPHLHVSAVEGRSPFVLNVSAVVAEQPMAGMAPYTAVKAGLAAFDAAAGRELRRSRIRLVDARPPHTETGLAEHPIAGRSPVLPKGQGAGRRRGPPRARDRGRRARPPVVRVLTGSPSDRPAVGPARTLSCRGTGRSPRARSPRRSAPR